MKIVIRTALFHLLCIIIFALIYLYLSEHFQTDQDIKHNSFTDFLLLSTTVQAGVGVSELYPISFYSKMVLIIQQILLIFTHLITLYIFTL
jgi:hypothetical protein